MKDNKKPMYERIFNSETLHLSLILATSLLIIIFLVFVVLFQGNNLKQSPTNKGGDVQKKKSSKERRMNKDRSPQLQYEFSPGNVLVYSFLIEGTSKTAFQETARPDTKNKQSAKIRRQIQGRWLLRILKETDPDTYLASVSVEDAEATVNSSIPYEKYIKNLKRDLDKPVFLNISSSGHIDNVRVPKTCSLQGIIFWINFLDQVHVPFPKNLSNNHSWKKTGENAFGRYRTRYRITDRYEQSMTIQKKNISFLRHLFGGHGHGNSVETNRIKKSQLEGGATYKFDLQEGRLITGEGDWISKNLVAYMGGYWLNRRVSYRFSLRKMRKKNPDLMETVLQARMNVSGWNELDKMIVGIEDAKRPKQSSMNRRKKSPKEKLQNYLFQLENSNSEIQKASQSRRFVQISRLLKQHPILSDDVSTFLQKRSTGDSRRVLFDALGEAGHPEAQQVLVEYLKSPNLEDSKKAMRGSWNVTDPKKNLIRAVSSVLDSTDTESEKFQTSLRTAGILTWRSNGDNKSKDELFEKLLNRGKKATSARAIKAFLDGLANSRRPRAAKEIIRVFESSNSEKIKLVSLRSLGHFQSDPGTKFLLDVARSSEMIKRRETATRELVNHLRETEELPKRPRIISYLRDHAIESKHPGIRKAALHFLKLREKLGFNGAMKKLTKHANEDPAKVVRQKARDLIENQTN